MVLRQTKLLGAFIIEAEKFDDERGFFARSWSQNEFAKRGLESSLVECNISFNKKKGTLRGMHYQASPHGQVKIVRCTMGSVYDVIIDLRTGSPTFKQWLGVELTATNRLMLYAPKEFAHGFQTLEDNTEVFYQMFEAHHPESARSVRWNDPAFGIKWPLPVEVIAARDAAYENFNENLIKALNK